MHEGGGGFGVLKFRSGLGQRSSGGSLSGAIRSGGLWSGGGVKWLTIQGVRWSRWSLVRGVRWSVVHDGPPQPTVWNRDDACGQYCLVMLLTLSSCNMLSHRLI